MGEKTIHYSAGKTFIIDSLPRTGSTTLARLLNIHPEVKCLIEPFHPRRFDGHFHQMAIHAESPLPALDLIWCQWTGIKHVWEANGGWPFKSRPSLNDDLILGTSRVLFLRRRNCLRRLVSSLISKQMNFWVGTKTDFLTRLNRTQLKSLEPDMLLAELQRDQAAIESRLRLFSRCGIKVKHMFFEDIYGDQVSESDKWEILNAIFAFLEVGPISRNMFSQNWLHLFDREIHQWSSPAIYRLIPGIEEIDQNIGSNETGWLFR
jgi:hypothetical protein